MFAKHSRYAAIPQDCERPERGPSLGTDSAQHNQIRQSLPQPYLRHSWLVHLIILLSYTILFAASTVYLRHQYRNLNPDTLHHTPLREALRTEVRPVDYNFDTTSPFFNTGPVSSIDDNWLSLLNTPHNVRVPSAEIARTNLTTIELADGSGDGLVQPIAYHMLHCLYNIYKYAHLDYYGEDPSGPAWRQHHTDHCVDNLRQFVMCHGGGGVSTFQWLEDRKLPWPVISDTEVCVDWNHYESWVGEHSIDITKKTLGKGGLLVHPTLGQLTNEDYASVEEGIHHGGNS